MKRWIAMVMVFGVAVLTYWLWGGDFQRGFGLGYGFLCAVGASAFAASWPGWGE